MSLIRHAILWFVLGVGEGMILMDWFSARQAASKLEREKEQQTTGLPLKTLKTAQKGSK